jgi:outer membrane lipoprotein-sorting protein
MRPADSINGLIRKLQLKASADLDARVHDDISAALAGYEKTQSVRSESSKWRAIMRGKTARLAAAAVILIGVLVLTSVFVETNESVVLAGVLERVEQAQAFMYKGKMTITGDMFPAGKQEIQTTMIISNEHGMKYEMNMGIPDPNTGKAMTQQMYILPNRKLVLSLMPERKKYTRMKLDDDLLARMKKQNNDPREMMKQILGCEYTELGRSEIDGIEVEGFETTDPKFSAGMAEDVNIKLWVDVETWLPVLWEMDMTMNEQMKVHGVISDFQWDIPVVASDFEPVIPEDFTSMIDDGYKMPSMTEEAALEGLKFFADMSGQYPKKIDMISLMREFTALNAGEGRAGARLKLKEELKQMAKGQDLTKAAITKTMEARIKARVTKRMEMRRPVQSLGMFYMTLVGDDKEPVYYGETVGPDDADAVLMRWKVSDGQYRVVFGDLLTSDVTPEELAELEKP